MDAKTGRKPLPTLEVVQEVHRSLNLEPPTERVGLDVSPESAFRDAGRKRADDQIQQLGDEYEPHRQAKLNQLQATVDKAESRLEDLRHQKTAQLEQKAELERRTEQIIPAFEAEKSKLNDSGSLDPHAESALIQRYEDERNETTQKLETLEKNVAAIGERITRQAMRLTAAEKSLEQTKLRLQAQRNGVEGRLREFPIGQPVGMVSNKSAFCIEGVVVDVQRTKNASNPVNPSSWRLKLQLASEAREVTIKFSDIGRDILLKPQEDTLVFKPRADEASMMASADMLPTYEVFDAKQKATRETRYMVIGQVLATDLTGTFAQMQDDRGQYHPAYLLPKTFTDKEIDGRPVGLDCPEQVQAFLEATSRTAKLTDRSGKLTLEFNVQRNLIVLAPTGKEGKPFVQDTTILEAAADNQFVSSQRSVDGVKQSSMRMVIKDQTVQDAVLSAIQRRHGIKAVTRLDDAKAVMGATQSGWEATTTWLPKDENTQVNLKRRAIHPLLKTAMDKNPELIPESQKAGDLSRPDIIQRVSERLYQGASLPVLKEEFQLVSTDQVRQVDDDLKGAVHQETDAVLATQEHPEVPRMAAEGADGIRQMHRDCQSKAARPREASY